MKKIFFLSLFLFAFVGIFISFHFTNSISKVEAVEFSVSPSEPDENDPAMTITIAGLAVQDEEYGICLSEDCVDVLGYGNYNTGIDLEENEDGTGKIVFTVCGDGSKKLKTSCGDGNFFHATDSYLVAVYNKDGRTPLESSRIYMGHAYPNSPTFSTDSPTNTTPLSITLCGNRHPSDREDRNKIDFDITGSIDPDDPEDLVIPDGGCNDSLIGTLATGDYTLKLRWQGETFNLYTITISVTEDGGEITIGKNESTPGGVPDSIKTKFDPACGEPGGDPCPTEINTPLGFIGTDAASFANSILSLGIGIAGGVAFLLMIFGAYRLMFAGGNPDAIQQGREVITAAIAGLIVVIFAVFILRFLGFTVLGIGAL